MGLHEEELPFCGAKEYGAPSKESTFMEILISAIKSTSSHSNQHKSVQEVLGQVSSEFVFPHITANREAIEVQKQFLGVNCQNFNKTDSISGYLWS